MMQMSKPTVDTLEKVSGEFESEVLSDLEEGRTEAISRLGSSKKEAAEAVSKTLETSVKQAESVKRQILGAAELDVRNAQLKSMERAVTEVFDLSTKEVSGISGAVHEKALAHLISEGIDAIGPKARVHCAPKDRKAVAAAIHKLNAGPVKLTLEEDGVESIGGVVLTTPDGSVKFDNTFEARLERMRPALRKEVADLLTAS